MTLSMYSATIPVFIFGLKNLAALLTKAEAHAQEQGMDPSELLNARLYEDMFPLVRQVQITTDIVKGGAARLGGVEVPSYADTEVSFGELRARIQKTIDFLQTFSVAQIDGTETKPIQLKVGGTDMTFDGQGYALKFVIPNFYFHISVAYSILRHNGVKIGKRDFLGPIQ